MIKLAVFVSGRGSNLSAILTEIDKDVLDAEVKLVVSNKSACKAFEEAKQRDILCVTVSSAENIPEDFKSYAELLNLLADFEIDLIVLAGFLKKIPDELIDKFRNRIINIHPALLPSFGGKGMYGLKVHEAVFNNSCQVSGATVHFVDNIYDNGKIIAQECVNISKAESPEEVAQMVLKVEHKLLPSVIKAFSEDRIEIKNNRVVINI